MPESTEDRKTVMPHGVYSVERQCPYCSLKTWSRDEFWAHVVTEHNADSERDAA